MSLTVNIQHKHSTELCMKRDEIIQAGWKGVYESTAHEGWSMLGASDHVIASSWIELKNAFLWSDHPPEPSSLLQHWKPIEFQPWETDLVEDELTFMFRVEELQDFEHSASSQYTVPRSARALVSPTPMVVVEAISQAFNPKHHYMRPLHSSIISGTSGLSFSKHPCVTVTPYHGTTPVACLGSAWARCAWVVPVDGGINLSQCSPARFHFDSSSIEKTDLTGASMSASTIVWTSSLLYAFWDFAQTLRTSIALGPISISIHTPAITEESHQDRNGLNALYHFKIYQDANVALHVRNALDLWGVAQEGSSKKIRLLKGHYFLLVTEKDQPVLVA